MRFLAIYTVLSAVTLLAAERMNVSVCNLGHLNESLITRAEAEAANAFRSFGIEVVWAKCGDEVGPGATDRESRILIRLRNDRPPQMAGLASLDAMGRAFVLAPGEGRIADVYYKATRIFADEHTADLDALIGYVIVHEIGHLLLGPGHSARGIMHSPWKGRDVMALDRRWLKFSAPQQAEILRRLHALNSERDSSEPAR